MPTDGRVEMRRETEGRALGSTREHTSDRFQFLGERLFENDNILKWNVLEQSGGRSQETEIEVTWVLGTSHDRSANSAQFFSFLPEFSSYCL